MVVLLATFAGPIQSIAVPLQGGQKRNVNQDEKVSEKAFLLAAQSGDLETVKNAIAQKIDVDTSTDYGATALFYACDRGHLEIVKVLIAAGADVNVKDTFYGASPLTWASSAPHYDIITELFKAGATGAKSTLNSAASSKDEKLFDAVVASGKVSDEDIATAKKRMLADPAADFKKAFEALPSSLSENANDVSASDAKNLVGQYRANSGITLGISDKDGLKVTLVGSELSRPLSRINPDGFQFQIGDARVRFLMRDSNVRALRWAAGETTITFRPMSTSTTGNNNAKPAVDKGTGEFKMDSADSLAADLKISSANWAQFRGNGARGVAQGQGPPVQWDATKDNGVLWKTPIPGLGNSSPAIWGNQLFVTTAVSDKDSAGLRTGNYGDVKSVDDSSEHSYELYCLDKNTGKVLWKKIAIKAVPKVKRHLKSTHANPTPATNGEFVIAFFASEGLYCYRTNGELAWKKDLGKLDSGWFYDAGYQWEFAASPIIYKDTVIVQCDIQENSFIAAYSLASGSELWRTDRDEIPSWSTPTVVETSRGPILATNATKFARGYNPENGKELWRVGGHSEIVVPTPFVAHDLIFITSGYRPIQPIFAIKPDASGDMTPSKDKEKREEKNASIAWSKSSGGPYMPTPICYGDCLYTCSNQGVLTCYQATTGKRVYKTRIATGRSASFVGSPVAADGHLYFPAENGTIIVVKAGPVYEKIGENPVGEAVLSSPAISEGVFYVRGQENVFAFGKR